MPFDKPVVIPASRINKIETRLNLLRSQYEDLLRAYYQLLKWVIEIRDVAIVKLHTPPQG